MRSTKLVLASLLLLVMALPVCAGKKEKAKAEGGPEGSGAAVAAYLGEEPITLEEVDRMAGGRIMRIRLDEYDLRRGIVEQILWEKLAEKEAAKRGVTVSELLATEVDGKAPSPTAEEIDQFYQQNKPRLANKPLEEVRPQIERQLHEQKKAVRRQAFHDELVAKADVRILLDAPRVDVRVPAGEPSQGPADAPVTIVEFSDFQCGFCRRVHETVGELLREYGGRVRFVYRDFPLQNHARAMPASEAARCAGDQGKYWEYHNSLFTSQGDLSDEDLKKRAGDLGLDAAAFGACLDSDRHVQALRAALSDGSQLGVTGTPTFFINGRMVVGAKPLSSFKMVIDEELKRSGQKARTAQVGG